MTESDHRFEGCTGAPYRAFGATWELLHTLRSCGHMSERSPFDDPVPRSVVLSLDDAFRVLEAIEDARLALRERGAAPGLQDELATVIRMLHGKLGFDEGGVQ